MAERGETGISPINGKGTIASAVMYYSQSKAFSEQKRERGKHDAKRL